MSGDILSLCANNCDTTKIAWEYIIEHQTWIKWILGGVFVAGNFTGWLITTLRYILKHIDKQQTIIVHPSSFKGGTSHAQAQDFTNDSSSSLEITKLPT